MSNPRHAEPAALSIAHEHHASAITLRLHGRLTAATQPLADAALRTALDTTATALLLDLAAITHLDPAGVRFLARAQLHCAAERRALTIRQPPRHDRRACARHITP